MVIVGALTLIGMANLDYGYYVFLRWAVSAAAVLLAVVAWRNKQENWLWLAAPVFILWFPLFGVFFDKSLWIMLDLAAGIGFIFAGIKVVQTPDKDGETA